MAGFFDRIGRAFGKFWDEITLPDNPEPGHFDAPDLSDLDFPTEAPQKDIFGNHGDEFPPNWGEPEVRLWGSEPQTYRDFYDNEEWQQLIEAFDKGWIRRGVPKPERESSRQDFYDLSNTLKSSFDWDAYRAYLAEVGSPTLAR